VIRPEPDRSGFLEVPAEDVRVHWDYFGRGEREVFVFLNGLGMSTESWFTSVPRVHPEFDVLLFDYLGQGGSTRADVPYSIPRFCDYLARIMDSLDIDAVHTQGVSYGGFVAAEFGRLFRDRVHTQVLSGVQLTSTHSFAMYQDLSLRFYDDPACFDLYTRYLYEKIFSEKLLERIHDKVERMRAKFFDNYRDDVRCLGRLTEAQVPLFAAFEANAAGYGAVTAPTLVIAGEHDRAIPLWAQEPLLDLFPNSRLIVLPRCGHLTYLEEPEAFWGFLLQQARDKAVAACA